MSWSLPLQFCGTRPPARRASAGAKRKGGVLATQGLREPRGAQMSPQRPQCMCFCVSLELERGWFLVTKTVHKKCSSRGAKDSRCHRIAGSGRIGGEKDGNGSIPSTWSECCPRSRSRCTARRKRVSLKQRDADAGNGSLWLLLNYSPLP